MRILAIETSCDETGISLIETTGVFPDLSYKVLGNALQSQIDVHKEYGGVFPALAKREHGKNMVPVLMQALSQAHLMTPALKPSITQEQLGEIKIILEREPELFVQLALFFAQYEKPPIDAIAVTVGPGLEPALWVGINTARALAYAWSVPVIAVNHMEGHIAAALVESEQSTKYKIQDVQFPAVVLLVSGGHTELLLMKNWFEYELLGETRDDAAGEAFDKSARMMGLPYPGGPEISKLAHEARIQGVSLDTRLPRPMLHSGNLDFSYSGLKNAVRLLLEAMGAPTAEQKKLVAREVEDAIVETLIAKARRALQEHGARTLIVSGGVSANAHLKTELTAMAHTTDTALLISTPQLATDNGLMIALAGALRASKNEYTPPETLSASGNMRLA